MFKIENNNMYLNRGDSAIIRIENETSTFEVGDIVKFSIMKRNNCNLVLFQKTYTVEDELEDNRVFEISLTPDDSKSFCPSIKTNFQTFWYEIELQSGDVINTLLGYDENGPKEFVVYPEAASEEEK